MANEGLSHKPTPAPDALRRALRLLAYRDRSSHEIRSRLRDKGHALREINEVVSYLRDRALLNDHRFAERWIVGRLSAKPVGRRVLTKQLRQKGVHPEVIAEEMDRRYPASEERERAVAVARQHARHYRRQEPDAVRRRLYGLLARRGFTASDCRAAVEAVAPGPQHRRRTPVR